LLADLEEARTEIALLKEELSIKDARWSRVSARQRPQYGPVQRMRILQLRAARGWSTAQAAQVFTVTEETIVSWFRRIDEGGERALVQLPDESAWDSHRGSAAARPPQPAITCLIDDPKALPKRADLRFYESVPVPFRILGVAETRWTSSAAGQGRVFKRVGIPSR